LYGSFNVSDANSECGVGKVVSKFVIAFPFLPKKSYAESSLSPVDIKSIIYPFL